MRKQIILFLFISLFLGSCSSSKLNGLWQVEKVQMQGNEMTPVARWVKLDELGKQKSGNGWYQHSTGSWFYDEKSHLLTIKNENGIIDPYDPFKVHMMGEKMLWARSEDGQLVQVTLKRIEEIPTSPADQLIGLWDMVKATDGKVDVRKKLDPMSKRYLHLRWDKRFNLRNTDSGNKTGTYRVNAHRNQIELIFYEDSPEIEVWDFKFVNNQLLLEKSNTDQEIKHIYERIYTFPE